VPIPFDQLPDDTAALKRIIAAMAQDAVNAQAEIAKLRFQLARYRRAEFGRSSERLEREIDQLELAIETLEADQAERLAAASPIVAAAIGAAAESKKPARRALPEHLPREDRVHAAPHACPECGGVLRGTVRNFVRGWAVKHDQAMARVKRSPKRTANWALAIHHSRGGMIHSFSERFKTRKRSFVAASSLGKCPLARTARRSLELSASIAFVTGMKIAVPARSAGG
jgi:transposase IS166 family protein